jgi:hypothetical protein
MKYMELILKNKHQAMIAECLWICQTEEETAIVIKSFGPEAETIKQLLVLAYTDDVDDCTEANEILKSVM